MKTPISYYGGKQNLLNDILKFLLSSYPSAILQNAIKLNGWESRQIVKNLSAGQDRTGKTKIECLTYNYKLENTLFD